VSLSQRSAVAILATGTHGVVGARAADGACVTGLFARKLDGSRGTK
jgi:hypothetical protein